MKKIVMLRYQGVLPRSVTRSVLSLCPCRKEGRALAMDREASIRPQDAVVKPGEMREAPIRTEASNKQVQEKETSSRPRINKDAVKKHLLSTVRPTGVLSLLVFSCH